MKTLLLLIILCTTAWSAQAGTCEGGLYLNPQVIRGEGRLQTASAADTLGSFLKPTGLLITPILNIRETQEVAKALKWAIPPCWVYGNPVVGLAAGYRPAAVNMEAIQAAVLILGPMGDVRDGKPVNVNNMPPAQAQAVLGRLKASGCYGMKSGVTTSLVHAEKLCGSIDEVLPQQGLGQSYLPTKAAFEWTPNRWVGVITRQQSAEATTLKQQFSNDSRIHMASLYVVPTRHASWGYGLYVHPQAPAAAIKKAKSAFAALDRSDPAVLRALDVGARFEFREPSESAVDQMRKLLEPAG